ncbi:Kazal type serine protease inhibitor [Mactra antiquata]
MEKLMLIFILALFVGGISCHPRRFIDCNNFECTEPWSPICGSNGITYNSECMMDVENRKRLCWMGHYNIITKVSDGPCGPSTTYSSI